MAPVRHWDSKTCPYAQRSWVTLLEKKIPFEIKVVDLQAKSEEFQAKYKEINPDPTAAAKVPILEDGDVKLVESLVIVDYLEQRYQGLGTRLLPADAGAAARVRLFIEAWNTLFMPSVFAILRADSAEGVAAGREKLAGALSTLDAFITLHGSSKGGDYFLGGDYSMAEVAAVGFIQRASVVLPPARNIDLWQMIEEQKLGRLKSWLDATLARPSSLETKMDDELCIKGWTKFVAPMKSSA